MRERGTVCEANDGVVTVRMSPSVECINCGACSEGDGGARTLSGVIDPLGSRPGDVVEIEVADVARRRAQLLVFVVPVGAVVLGYLAGFLLFSGTVARPDTAGALTGLAAGSVALLSLRFFGRSAAGSDGYEPRVRAIISRGSQRRSDDDSSIG
jgi:sigma-E factor negative regulatory protein RseC